MRISKVYTRTGDGGKTRLAGGQEVWKDSIRVEAYGTVDELNSVLGLIRGFNQATSKPGENLDKHLRWIQSKLFDLGGLLATPTQDAFPNRPSISSEDATYLERIIDDCQQDLAPLKEFILPGGGVVSGYLHLARTVCRRAERVCVTLSKEEPLDQDLIRFLNRLSDTLFVLARWMAKQHDEPEFLWERTSTPAQ